MTDHDDLYREARRILDELFNENTAALYLAWTGWERATAIERTFQAWIDAAPAMMSTPLGLLPINDDGMRQLVDHLAMVQRERDETQAALVGERGRHQEVERELLARATAVFTEMEHERDGRLAEGGAGMTDDDGTSIGRAVTCRECGLRKAPRGRSVPLGLHLCDQECPGWNTFPRPGDLWPGETAADFGFPCEGPDDD